MGSLQPLRLSGRTLHSLRALNPKTQKIGRRNAVTPYESRLIELFDRIEETLRELREHVRSGPSPGQAEAIEAFADEAFRARDA